MHATFSVHRVLKIIGVMSTHGKYDDLQAKFVSETPKEPLGTGKRIWAHDTNIGLT
jgi:hypothetical protein